jgi:chromosome segregation ATPase
MRARTWVVGAALGAALLAGCSSGSEPDEAIASLEARLVIVEDRLAGVEAVVGQALIAEPAAQLQAELDALEKDIANAQLPDDVTADLDAAKQAVADAQKAAQDAVAAEAAEDAATAEAIAAAQKAIADAQAKLEAVKEKIRDYLASASPTPSAAPTGSPSAS